MERPMKYLKRLFYILLLTAAQITTAQTPHKKAVGAARPGGGISVPNYIAQEITKSGAGDKGIFYDTLRNKIKPTDAANATGRQYQDIKLTLETGDVVKVSLSAESITPMRLTLLHTSDGRLSQVNAIIDTAYSSVFTLFYKASDAGIYTLRVACQKRAPKVKDDRDYYYENNTAYTLNCVTATPASGTIAGNASVCDQLQFLLRQRLTNFMQITGETSDTTMDVLDKKKIQSVNHFSTFTFYKNSRAKINVDLGFDYIAFEQSLLYSSDADAGQAQRYFIAQFKTCLGSDWSEETDSNDPNWHKFKKSGQHPVNIILYPGYKYMEILM